MVHIVQKAVENGADALSEATNVENELGADGAANMSENRREENGGQTCNSEYKPVLNQS